MKKKGQSLIEILVAIGILGVMLVGVVAGATVGLKGARISRERAYAKSLADKKTEQVRTIRDTDPDLFFDLGSRNESATDSTGPGYTITTTYTLQPSGVLMSVVVVVGWTDGNSSYNVTESTYLSKQ